MRLPWPLCPLAGQSRFGQNVCCGSMSLLWCVMIPEIVPGPAADSQSYRLQPPLSAHLPLVQVLGPRGHDEGFQLALGFGQVAKEVPAHGALPAKNGLLMCIVFLSL